MFNWKTTVFGALAALLPYVKSVLPAEFGQIADGVAALALALMGYFAADKSK
jgi:hypothetical protein